MKIKPCKILIGLNNAKLSEEIQNICFKHNVLWNETRSRKTHPTEAPFLYIQDFITFQDHGDCDTMPGSMSEGTECFINDPLPEIEPRDFINMYSTPPAPFPHPDTKPSNPKDMAATTRLDLSVFPDTATIFGALAMTEGDYKYGAFNYREVGVNVSVYKSAVERHIKKYYNGEWADAKTKVPHLASALAGIAILIDGHIKGNLNDDRPPSVDIAGLLDEMEKNVAHLQKLFPRKTAKYTQIGVEENDKIKTEGSPS